MATITEYFEQAQLSMAAYALNLQAGMSSRNQTDAYIDRLETGGMSLAQAAEFAKTYTVLDQHTDWNTGFSATIFEKAGVKHFAIRGTNNVIDWFGTNFGDIGADGIAIDQGLALFNYLQRLKGAAGSAVVNLLQRYCRASNKAA